MKKLNVILCSDDTWSEYEEDGVRVDDIPANKVIKKLIDLVNSQQEAIGELQTEIGVLRNMVLQSQEAIERLQEHVDHEARHVSEPADDKPEYPWTDKSKARVARYEQNLAEADTHRTVTLRIPKGMTVGKAIWSTLDQRDENCLYRLFEQSDTDLQKALDEVQPNE